VVSSGDSRSDSQEGVKQFEGMIVSEAQRLQSEGKTGLQILPGVQDMLDIVRTHSAALSYLSSAHLTSPSGPSSPRPR